MKHNIPKSIGHDEGSPKKIVYSTKCLYKNLKFSKK